MRDKYEIMAQLLSERKDVIRKIHNIKELITETKDTKNSIKIQVNRDYMYVYNHLRPMILGVLEHNLDAAKIHLRNIELHIKQINEES
jgi:hypothetical protein